MVLSDLPVHLDKTPETGGTIGSSPDCSLTAVLAIPGSSLASDRRAFIHGSAA